MPHFNEAGQDLALCQVCGNDTTEPQWRPDITGSASFGNVCPNCVLKHDDGEVEPPVVAQAQPVAVAQFTITPEWVLAGKAIFTVANASGQHYTFRVAKKQTQGKPPIWFLGVLTGQDNEHEKSYTYVGVVHPDTLGVRLTAKSKYTEQSKPVTVARWALGKIKASAALPEGYSISGNGRCGRCGRMLTHPDGIANDGYRLGFGAHCWNVMHG